MWNIFPFVCLFNNTIHKFSLRFSSLSSIRASPPSLSFICSSFLSFYYLECLFRFASHSSWSFSLFYSFLFQTCSPRWWDSLFAVWIRALNCETAHRFRSGILCLVLEKADWEFRNRQGMRVKEEGKKWDYIRPRFPYLRCFRPRPLVSPPVLLFSPDSRRPPLTPRPPLRPLLISSLCCKHRLLVCL